MGPLPDEPSDPQLLALGFVLARPEVDTVIVGTHNPDHIRANIKLVERGLPISSRNLEELYKRFDHAGEEWRQRT
jgi:aryl-alcohol dehydrogenase-like predicted oxidoreductase